MFAQISLDTILFFMLYGVGTAVAGGACLYLLLQRANAFAPDVVPPARLRWWTAAFFGVIAVGHLWYIPVAVLDSSEDVTMGMLVGGLYDCVLIFPLVIAVMLCMLQDRRRPLWPAWVLMLPPVVGVLACMATCSYDYLPMARIYFLLMGACLVVYLVRAVRQYGRWLRDNYADLEHKELWQTFVVLATIVLILGYYVVGYNGGMAYEYIVQILSIVLICHLLWRVETLQDLETQQEAHPQPLPVMEGSDYPVGEDTNGDTAVDVSTPLAHREGSGESLPVEQIGSLLKQHCEDTRLYLQHGLTLAQLAQAIGTNRTYLGLYFVRQNTTYNTYINDLRIFHFVSLYRETVAAGRKFTAQQLATQSGYRSYKTFSLAFKQRMGKSVTEWTNAPTE